MTSVSPVWALELIIISDDPNLTEALTTKSASTDIKNASFFGKNMAFFQRAAPHIYQQYINHQPQELVVTSMVKDGAKDSAQQDAQAYLNLVNIKHNSLPVYSNDPLSFCTEQVEKFIRQPKVSTFRYTLSKVYNDKHIQVPLMNTFIEQAKPYTDVVQPHCNVPIGLLVVTGCGLGYHIPQLVDKLDVYNLVIFDPYKDSFYASLHSIDWEPVVRFFTQKGRSLQLFLGVESKDAMLAMQNHVEKIGLHNVAYSFHYKHLDSAPAQQFIATYRKEFHLNALGRGFFDDEQVGLAHTISNLNRGVKVFRENPRAKHLPPVFVVANGPSLDEHIQFLKENAAKTIVVSCGTAIASLAKAQIKPDFHIEMERNSNIKEWLEHGTTADFRKGVTLLCLNTVAPGVLDLFDDYCIAKKPNDIGGHLIDAALDGAAIEPLALCNPTVANAGLSFSLAMGFKQVYLFGVDLGIQKTGQHHSKLSIYYDLERATEEKGHSEFEDDTHNYFVKANFGGEISTNAYFDSTRLNMEILLRYYRRTCNDVYCYNPNDGAFIEGTTAIRQENIALSSAPLDKSALVNELKIIHFETPHVAKIVPEAFIKKHLKPLFDARESLALEKEVSSPFDVYRNLSRVYENIHSQSRDPILQHLLLGSINTYFSMIIKASLFQRDTDKIKDAYRMGQRSYTTFLDRAYRFMKETPLELDDTYDNIGDKFAGSKGEIKT